MKRLLGFEAIGSLVAAVLFFAVMPVWADGVEDKIKVLEDELAKLKTQQIEMKKEATAAADAMPTFSYRKGRGMTITAADRSWVFNLNYRLDIHMNNHLKGRSHFFDVDSGEEVDGETGAGELAPRRNRLNFTFCWDSCFIEVAHSFDGESGVRSANFRDNEIMFHFEQWNPFLPMFSLGLRRGAGDTHLARSSSSDAKMEHHMLLGWGDWGGSGSHAGAGLHWDGVEIGPAEYNLFLNWASSSQGTHADFLASDRKGFMGFTSIKPFAKSKSKWLEGFEPGVGLQFHSIDSFDGRDHEIETHEERGGQTLIAVDDIGDGFSYIVIPGVKWRIGPYQVRANYLRTQTEGRSDDHRGVQGKGWEIANQMFIWSPKGFLTGSSSTPGSLLLGFAFERADVECGVIGCNDEDVDGTHKRLTVLNREVGLWYWINPALRVGSWWHFYKSSNTPHLTQVAVGCKNSTSAALAGKSTSRECDWWSWNLGINYRW